MNTSGNRPFAWLVPVASDDPMRWAHPAVPLGAAETAELLALARTIHPRWLMLLKWRSLLADSDEMCGTSDMEQDTRLAAMLEAGVPVTFGRSGDFELSHCAEAFFDGRLPLNEALRLAGSIPRQDMLDPASGSLGSATETERHPEVVRLFGQLMGWREQGIDGFLLRGDN